VVEGLRITGRRHHPFTVGFLHNLTIFVTHRCGDPQVGCTKRRHRTPINEFLHVLAALVVLYEGLTVAVRSTIPVAVHRDYTVVRKFVTDARASAHWICLN
jgi:hypothetical protein